jgi:hypothetical protein
MYTLHMDNVVIRIPVDLARQLDERARSEMRSRNNMVVRILNTALRSGTDEPVMSRG